MMWDALNCSGQWAMVREMVQGPENGPWSGKLSMVRKMVHGPEKWSMVWKMVHGLDH